MFFFFQALCTPLTTIISNAYHWLLDTLGNKIDKTQSDVKELQQTILTRLDGPYNNTPDDPPQHIDIPLNPLRINFPLTKWWFKDLYLNVKSGRATHMSATSINSTFLEDPRGLQISPELLESLLGDVRGFWNDRKDASPPLCPWNKMGLRIKEEFRTLLEGKYPFLRLCEGHWKVGQLWINHYSAWERNNPIVVSSDDEPSSRGRKRNRSDDDEVSSGGRKPNHSDNEELEPKKRKGKEVATSNFHPPRPSAKKRGAGVIRVCNLLFLLPKRPLKPPRRAHCT